MMTWHKDAFSGVWTYPSHMMSQTISNLGCNWSSSSCGTVGVVSLENRWYLVCCLLGEDWQCVQEVGGVTADRSDGCVTITGSWHYCTSYLVSAQSRCNVVCDAVGGLAQWEEDPWELLSVTWSCWCGRRRRRQTISSWCHASLCERTRHGRRCYWHSTGLFWIHYRRQRRRYMFLPLFVCLSVCSKITQKRVHGFRWNVACWQKSGHGRTD